MEGPSTTYNLSEQSSIPQFLDMERFQGWPRGNHQGYPQTWDIPISDITPCCSHFFSLPYQFPGGKLLLPPQRNDPLHPTVPFG